MWATLVLMSAMNWTPAQAGQLELKNARFTYGWLGQERKDATFLPGDLAILSYDIEGLKVAPNGTVRFSMGLELTNKKGDKVFSREPQEVMRVNTLGGTRRPEYAVGIIGTDTLAGEYTMTVSVTDLAAKNGKPAKLVRNFQVLPMRFGFVRLGFMLVDLNERGGGDPQLAPPLAVPGQNLLLNFALVGFELKGDKELPNLAVTMEVQDENGKAVLEKPFSGMAQNIEEVYKKEHVIPFHFPIQLNRSGKFKVAITATDKYTNKTAKQTLDLKVVEVEVK